ncbi:MAG: STAS/SEC14 domain-containing protein [Thermoanaerobaculia bacterium]|nr:STAS/SEC14 domain-containing protein [Thermoanaerobaculia bacterium]
MFSYSIDTDHERGFVRVTARGEAELEEAREVITEARIAAAEHGYPLLYDLREVIVQVSLTEWFYLPRELEVLRDEKTVATRVAALLSSDPRQRAGYELYEAATHNLGLTVKLFDDEDAALDWLLG